MLEIFEKATKDKIRFEYKGQVSVEDLWDLDVRELDSIYKRLNAQKKAQSEDSLLQESTVENTLLNTQIELVKHIVQYKIALQDKAKRLKEIAEKKQKIMEILESKQDSELEGKSTEELQEMLNSL